MRLWSSATSAYGALIPNGCVFGLSAAGVDASQATGWRPMVRWSWMVCSRMFDGMMAIPFGAINGIEGRLDGTIPWKLAIPFWARELELFALSSDHRYGALTAGNAVQEGSGGYGRSGLCRVFGKRCWRPGCYLCGERKSARSRFACPKGGHGRRSWHVVQRRSFGDHYIDTFHR